MERAVGRSERLEAEIIRHRDDPAIRREERGEDLIVAVHRRSAVRGETRRAVQKQQDRTLRHRRVVRREGEPHRRLDRTPAVLRLVRDALDVDVVLGRARERDLDRDGERRELIGGVRRDPPPVDDLAEVRVAQPRISGRAAARGRVGEGVGLRRAGDERRRQRALGQRPAEVGGPRVRDRRRDGVVIATRGHEQTEAARERDRESRELHAPHRQGYSRPAQGLRRPRQGASLTDRARARRRPSDRTARSRRSGRARASSLAVHSGRSR